MLWINLEKIKIKQIVKYRVCKVILVQIFVEGEEKKKACACKRKASGGVRCVVKIQ